VVARWAPAEAVSCSCGVTFRQLSAFLHVQPAFFGEIALMLWLLIKGPTVPAFHRQVLV
jgi:hypothetical protein